MRNRELHDALRDFALDAASLLTNDQSEGAELSYDVVEEPGRGPMLYRYEALTAQFIGDRWDRLRELDTYPRAARALGTGASSYLRVRGVDHGADAGPALRAMLERLYEDTMTRLPGGALRARLFGGRGDALRGRHRSHGDSPATRPTARRPTDRTRRRAGVGRRRCFRRSARSGVATHAPPRREERAERPLRLRSERRRRHPARERA